MTVVLPSWPEPMSAEPYFLDSGGWQEPAIGEGDAVRIDRLGDKHGLRVKMPPMKFNDPKGLAHARVWIQRLKRGMAEGARLKFPQPDFVTPANCTMRVVQAAQATLIYVNGPVGFTYREGTYLSIVHAPTGRRYLHSLNSDAIISGAGEGTFSVHPRIRIGVQVGWSVLFNPPEIEGMIVGNEQKWTLETARTVGLEFDIKEIR